MAEIKTNTHILHVNVFEFEERKVSFKLIYTVGKSWMAWNIYGV